MLNLVHLRVFGAALALASASCAAAADHCQYVNVAELPVQYTGAHLQPAVMGSINEKPAVMLLDTGASMSVLTPATPDKYGLNKRWSGQRAQGVGGDTRMYQSRVNQFAVGPIEARNRILRVIEDMPGEISYAAIIGSDFWMQADFELVLSEKKLRFFRPRGCDDDAFLGYWDQAVNVVPIEHVSGDVRPHVMVRINGVEVQALIDSGAVSTVLFRAAARRAGLNPEEVPLELAGFGQGVGTDRVRHYRAVADFTIGGETVKNARLQVSGDDVRIGGGGEMLLGQDWLRAHRLLFANSQRKLYFTWNGTEPFTSGGTPWYASEADAGNPDAQVLMGAAEDRRKHKDEAQAWYAKAAAQGHARANEILAGAALRRGQPADAERYLRVTLAAEPSNGRAALLMYAAQVSQDHADAAQKSLGDFLAHAQEDDWLRPVARFYLGQATEADALNAAGKDEDRVCAAHRAVARWYSLKKDEAHAKAIEEAGRRACSAMKA